MKKSGIIACTIASLVLVSGAGVGIAYGVNTDFRNSVNTSCKKVFSKFSKNKTDTSGNAGNSDFIAKEEDLLDNKTIINNLKTEINSLNEQLNDYKNNHVKDEQTIEELKTEIVLLNAKLLVYEDPETYSMFLDIISSSSLMRTKVVLENDDILVGNGGKLYKVNGQHYGIKEIGPISGTYTNSIKLENDNVVFYGSSANGIAFYDNEKEEVSVIEDSIAYKGLYVNKRLKNGNILFYSNSAGVFQFNITDKSFFKITDKSLNSSLELSSGNILLGNSSQATKGLYYYNFETEEFICLIEDGWQHYNYSYEIANNFVFINSTNEETEGFYLFDETTKSCEKVYNEGKWWKAYYYLENKGFFFSSYTDATGYKSGSYFYNMISGEVESLYDSGYRWDGFTDNGDTIRITSSTYHTHTLIYNKATGKVTIQ